MKKQIAYAVTTLAMGNNIAINGTRSQAMDIG